MIHKFGGKVENNTGCLAIDSIMRYWDKTKKYNDGFGEASLVKVKAVNLDKLLQSSCNKNMIVPIMSNESCNHSVCLTHNLIFDSSQKVALKRHNKSLNWIFGGPIINIYRLLKIPIHNDSLCISIWNINNSPVKQITVVDAKFYRKLCQSNFFLLIILCVTLYRGNLFWK